LLFYAVDGLGLGHVTRMLALARAVRRLSPGAEILFLTTSEASHVIYQEGFAALKLPSRTAASSGGLRGGSWLRLTQTVAWNAVAAFDPHCLIVDTFAAGTLQELLPILRWPLRKVFVFRAQRKERACDPFLQRTLELYDLILVPHAPDSEAVPIPQSTRAVWTGPMLLRDMSELLPRLEARRALGLPLEGEIGLFALGGGGEPKMDRARARMRRAAATNPQTLWVEAAGPLARIEWSGASANDDPMEAMPAHEYSWSGAGGASAGGASASGETEREGRWRTLRGVHPLMIFLRAFDYAVAAAGYNTTHELQAARVPSVLWPFARALDDQEARANRLAAAGRALCITQGSGDHGDDQGSEEASLNRGNAKRETAGALRDREMELARALAELARPEVRRKMSEAMDKAQQKSLSRKNDASASAGEALWRNGATIGAEAVLELLP